jgi:hypothetical protein
MTDGVLQGLERLVGFKQDCAAAPLPSVLKQEDLLQEVQVSEETQTRDFEIPSMGHRADRLSLRQVMNTEHPRITKQWWGVYENDLRVECWFFSPDGSEEGKLLAPYKVDEIIAAKDGSTVFRTHGGMHRPGGSGWMQGKDFVFAPSGRHLRLEHVLGRFFFSYRDAQRGSGVDLVTEQLVERGGARWIEIRARDQIPAGLLRKCGFQHPLQSELGDRDYYTLLARAAACLGKEPGMRTCHRPLGEPSFIERGGAPSACATAR